MSARLEELCWLEPEIKKLQKPLYQDAKNMYFFKIDTFIGSVVSMKIHLFVGFVHS
jgi:hypothetical protein